jgi:hypothetical protein
MNESALSQEPGYPTLHRDLPHDKALFHVPLRAADAARASYCKSEHVF